MTQGELFDIWCKASEQNCNGILFMLRGVRVKPIYNLETLTAYLAKAKQKVGILPVTVWSGFGKYRGKVEPLETVEGTAEELADRVRLLRKLAQSQRRKQGLKRQGRQRKFRDDGKRGFTLYGDGANAYQIVTTQTR
jgi:hypothetical protein